MNMKLLSSWPTFMAVVLLLTLTAQHRVASFITTTTTIFWLLNTSPCVCNSSDSFRTISSASALFFSLASRTTSTDDDAATTISSSCSAATAITLDTNSSTSTSTNSQNILLSDSEKTLDCLFGSQDKRTSFFINHFHKRVPEHVVYWPRDNDRLANDGDNLPAPIQGLDLESLYHTNDFIALRIRGSRDFLDKSKMSFEALQQYIDGGGSVVIPVTPQDYMSDFRQAMEIALNQSSVSMNVYHSGPSAVALNKHYDAYDVFVLQLEGRKMWTLQADGNQQQIDSIQQWRNVTLGPGDLLYIPQGIFHAATTADGCSTSSHVTIGLEQISY